MRRNASWTTRTATAINASAFTKAPSVSDRWRPNVIRALAGRRAELVGGEREHERADVARHVRRVGKKGQRAGHEPGDGFGDEEERVQRQRERQRGACVGPRVLVGMVVVVRHTLEISFK